jgi:hypothetical protein
MNARRTFGAIVVAACTCIALGAAELAARIVDGYRLTSMSLEASRDRQPRIAPKSDAGAQKWDGDYDALPYAEKSPVADGVDLGWFSELLPAYDDLQPDAELVARTARYKAGNDERLNYEWNLKEVSGVVCRGEHPGFAELFKQLDDAFVFDPAEESAEPPYRFLQHAKYSIHRQTNNFGWRGPDIALTKPAGTIRIAFVGASTTIGNHGFPYSFPEQVGLWLRRWAAARHPGVAIEVINAGREGINSRSLPAIVRQEVLPVEPDLLYYDYDGANQFWPGDFVMTPVANLHPSTEPRPGWLATHSAVGARVGSVLRRTIARGAEPPKPHLDLAWPADLDERDPSLSHPRLPVQLPQLLSDLEATRQELGPSGSDLVVTSIGWLVYPGMVLDPDRDAPILTMINTAYWPFSYAHIRRYLDFKTRTLRKYAAAHQLHFVDVAGSFPRDPRLFYDAIHTTRAGTRLQAWLVFNSLVPIIERHLTAHEWPRPATLHLASHPAFNGRRLVPMAQLRAACGNPGSSKHE